MNVLKNRQLLNEQYINSKQDFIKNNNVFDINGNVKKQLYLPLDSSNTIISCESVGKGQVISLYYGEDNIVYMSLFDRKGNILKTKNILNYETTNVFIKEYSYFKFLGKCNPNSEDRYIIHTQLLDDGTYYPRIFNIDTWTYPYTPRTSGGYSMYYEYLYDGENNIYINYNRDRIQYLNKNIVFEDGEDIVLSDLLDEYNNNVYLNNLWFIDEGKLFFGNSRDKDRLYWYEFDTGHISGRSEANKVVNNAKLVYGNDGNEYSSYLMYSNNTGIYIANANYGDSKVLIEDIPSSFNILHILNSYKENDNLIVDLIIGDLINENNVVNVKIIQITYNTLTYEVSISYEYTDIIPDYSVNEDNFSEYKNRYNNVLQCYNLNRYWDYGLEKQSKLRKEN